MRFYRLDSGAKYIVSRKLASNPFIQIFSEINMKMGDRYPVWNNFLQENSCQRTLRLEI